MLTSAINDELQVKHLEIVGVSSRCSCGREKSKFKTHYGKTKITFKERYKEHKQVFKNENSSMATALLRYKRPWIALLFPIISNACKFFVKWHIMEISLIIWMCKMCNLQTDIADKEQIFCQIES